MINHRACNSVLFCTKLSVLCVFHDTEVLKRDWRAGLEKSTSPGGYGDQKGLS